MRRVGYVMSRFPYLPETFILREMTGMAARGWDIRLYPLIRQPADLVHADALPWVRSAQYLSAGLGTLLLANIAELRRAPRTYLRLWAAVVRDCHREPGVMLRALALLPACVMLARLVRRDRVEHVHAHYATYPLLAAWTAHQLSGVSYSVTVHAHDIFMSQAMLGRKLADVSFIAAISGFNRDFVADHVGEQLRERTHIVHCGVDLARYSEHTPTGDVLDIVSIGSLQEYKGHEYLIEACRLLVERGVRVRCRIVGGGPDRERLQGRIDAADMGTTVLLLGPRVQEEVAEILSSANCYAQPSVITSTGQMEGIPVSLMEAMASGLPVVATRLSGVPELVRPDDTGWLVPPRDAGALADALEEIGRRDDRTAQIARRGRRLVEREFTVDGNVDQLTELLAQTQPAPAARQDAA